MRRVLVYVPRVLPLSLTFVADQARSLRRWHPELVGRERLPGGLVVDDLLAPEMRETSGPTSPIPRMMGQVTRRAPLLREVVARTHPELIHAHFLTGGFDVVATLPAPPCPLVVTAHGFDATWYGRPPRTLRPEQWLHGVLRRRLVRRPVHFVAVSHFIRDQLLRFGAPADRVVVHHTGVDTSYFTPPEPGAERRGILFVGRLVEKKGVFDLLEAVARLRADGIAPPVEIIGDGPVRADVERFVARERLDVRLRGAQPREEVRAAMQRAAVQCNPSRTAPNGDREGFGMVLAEAQATGLPVVASSSGGMVDAVDDGRTGLLVPEADPVAVSDALRRCLLEDGLHARLSAAARPWVVERFDLARQAAVLEDLYDAWSSPNS
ncbi:MAG: glycosyltransferase [Acidimicrobiales bacterium]